MGKIFSQPKVKLISGIMVRPDFDASAVFETITGRLGPIDLHTPWFDFSHTGYYKGEFGEQLKKQYFSLEQLVAIDDIPDLKIWSNQIEDHYLIDGSRTVNIDPGYMADAKVLMATTKNLAHRVYIGKNIFVDLQLIFRHHTFVPVNWTFADMKEPEVIALFNDVRAKYMEQLKELGEYDGGGFKLY
ncbi:DUF4416 family protein [bacterium]|nr:DUF4416 family protein [bacterium]